MTCHLCQRYADQRDTAMHREMGAAEREREAVSRLAMALDENELLEGDKHLLMTENAELRSRAERAERLIARRFASRRQCR